MRVEDCVKGAAINDDRCIVHGFIHLLHLIYYFARAGQLAHEEEVVLAGLEPRANSDRSCCLNLVTSEHPDLNASLFQRVNRAFNVILELILDTCYTQVVHILLERVLDSSDMGVTVSDARLSTLQMCQESFDLGIGQHSLCKNERSESLHCQVLTRLKE